MCRNRASHVWPQPTTSKARPRQVSRIDSLRELQAALPSTLSFSASGEAILEAFCPGLELNAVLVVRDGEPLVLTLSNRLRRRAGASLACGLLNGIAFPQLIVGEGGQVRVVEIGARVPAGQMAALVRHGTGVDLVEIVLLQALGNPSLTTSLSPASNSHSGSRSSPLILDRCEPV